jgi:hypothetical protein
MSDETLLLNFSTPDQLDQLRCTLERIRDCEFGADARDVFNEVVQNMMRPPQREFTL